MRILLVHGDITTERVDAIVNAANTGLRGGGGVDGAIHRAAGPVLAEECAVIRARHGGCRTGQAVITSAGELPAHHVIHTPGPVWQGGRHGEPELLFACYANSLTLAAEHGLHTLAFPAISTGVYAYPLPAATRIAFDAVLGTPAGSVEEVRFVLFSKPAYAVYQGEMARRGL